MDPLDRQTAYWDRVAGDKTFSNPLDENLLARHVPRGGRILDLGCGYGRLCGRLGELGYERVVGLDVSAEMIRRGRALWPRADLRLLAGERVPFEAGSFDAVLVVAVLTCIPGDGAQTKLIAEARRVLKPGGVIFVSDYPLQSDERNRARYAQFAAQYAYGVFELDEGVVLRHHAPDWIAQLLAPFEKISFEIRDVLTMNGHAAKIFQFLGRNPL